jgi:cytochrome c peroxidase
VTRRGNSVRARAVLLVAALLGAASAGAGEPPAPSPRALADAYDRVDRSQPFRFSKRVERPAAQVELGRKLFFDSRLSADGSLSCAACHDPAKAWTDGRPRARGLGGRELARNTPTLLDLRERTLFFWDGRAATLSDQVLFPIQSHQEMDLPLDALLERLRAVPDYERAFAAAFGGPATADGVARALAAFLETLETPADAPFDRGRADPEAMSPAARRGLVLFAGKARCLGCHAGPALTDNRFHNLGFKPGPGPQDPGRWAVVRTPESFGAFRTPSLRNVARTAPYMHDGRLRTLADVVAFYDRGGDGGGGRSYPLLPLGLTSRERSDLVAFLESLTSTVAPVAPPDVPAAAPARPGAVAAADARPAAPASPQTDRPEPPPAAHPPSAPSLDDACRDFSLETLLRALSADPGSPRAQAVLSAASDDAIGAVVDRALAAGSDAPCGALAGLSREFTGVAQSAAFFCRDSYFELSLLRAAAERSPELASACRAGLRWSYRIFDDADAGIVCSAIAEDLDRPARLCARLSPRYVEPRALPACEKEFAQLGGRALDCALDADPFPTPLEQRCAAYRLYYKARAAGSPDACGRDGQCRALMGDALGQARVLEERARARACGSARPD